MDARRMWRLLEPLHAVTYFAPEALEATSSRGLRGFWRGYMACRLAPLGPVQAHVAEAALFNFQPAFVARSIPSVWKLITPAEALQARTEGAVRALRRVIGAELPDLRDLRDAVAACDHGGRLLGAANADLPWPGDPLADLWHAATVLREHRGDGHIAVLVSEGLSGLDAHALRVAEDGRGREWVQETRGWSAESFDAATEDLRGRGFIAADGELTHDGALLRAHVEARTDALAEHPWWGLSSARLETLEAALAPLAQAAATVLPFPNPIGVPAPSGQ